MASATEEVAGLDKVLTRLATTEDNTLEKARDEDVELTDPRTLKFRSGSQISYLDLASLHRTCTTAHAHHLLPLSLALAQVLQKLIPVVIGSLKSPHDTTRKKVCQTENLCAHRCGGGTAEGKGWRLWPMSSSINIFF